MPDGLLATLSAQEIRDQSKAATLQYHQDTDKMRTLGASLISTIKAYAVTRIPSVPSETTNAPNRPRSQ